MEGSGSKDKLGVKCKWY